MPSRFIEPFNFKDILINYFLGTQHLLVFALVILVSFACAKFNVSNKTFFAILIISSLILAAFLGEAIYVLILILIGFFVFKGLGRFFQ